MKVTTKSIADTKSKMTITADEAELLGFKKHVADKLAKELKLPGFRVGKVPPELAEKHLDANYLQSQVLDEAINRLYLQALSEAKLRVVSQPKVELTKFVPYSSLEFTAEVDVIGKVSLPDYKTTTLKKSEVTVSEADIAEILGRIQVQTAQYNEVDRPAKDGDRVWIDFDGKDAKGEPVHNASGKDYPLALGSNTFIAGFEVNVIGLKKGDTKTFSLPFPKDYPVKALQSKKVTFDIKLNKIEETVKDEINDALAAKVGPFKNLEELKTDIKKQLMQDKTTQANREYEECLIKSLAGKTKVAIPQALIDEQMDAIDREFRQNLSYRKETFEDYLANNVLTEEEYKAKELKPLAEERIKAGLMLAEIADDEHITVSPEEVKIRIQVLKNQYKDEKMRVELDKPENQREVASRLLTEKTIHRLIGFAAN